MKSIKYIILFVLLVVLFQGAFVPAFASQELDNRDVYIPAHEGYTLQSMVKDTQNYQPVGVIFSGTYFNGINVEINVYTSDNFAIDFLIKDKLSAYTDGQMKRRSQLLTLFESIHSLITNVDARASTQYDGVNGRPLSDIFQYNYSPRGTKLPIDKVTYDMLLIAKEMYAATDGAFNPAVYRLVDLWGFSSRFWSESELPPQQYDRVWDNGYPLPEQKYIDAFSATDFIDFSDNAVTLSQENGQYFVTKNIAPAVVDGMEYQQWLDLGGIAKGYVVDEIKKKIEDLGIDRHNIDVGSSSIVFGNNYGGYENVLRIPNAIVRKVNQNTYESNGSMMSVKLGKASVSTSGQYIRKYTTNGVEYAHIIDGEKGAPAQTGVKLVTIIAPEGNFWAGKGDCLTTALTVMGKEGIVDFMNGYLKDNGIEIVVLYQAVDGSRQILSNIEQSSVKELNSVYRSYAWSVDVNNNGEYVYNPRAKTSSDLSWLVIVLGVLVVLGVAGVLVYYVIKGRKKSLDKITAAHRDKPFKLGDIAVYVAVVLVIAVLFLAFFSGKDDQLAEVVKVVDMSTQETLFVYNVARDEWLVNANESGWTLDVVRGLDDITVRFSKDFDGKTRFNEMTIIIEGNFSVKMTDSLCGKHQECVKTFTPISYKGGSIVCSPNNLKIITE